MQERIELLRGQSREVLEGSVREVNSVLWKIYEQGGYVEAAQHLRGLSVLAVEKGVDPELQAEILANHAWSEYYVAQDAKRKSETPYKDSYTLAKQGLDLSQNPLIRSRLFEVAGLSQAYLFEEQDEPAEQLFKNSIKEAEDSGVKIRLGEANNGFGLWLISPKQKKFNEAIPVFQEVVRIQNEEENKRGEGHAHNNLIVCYNETRDFEKAIGEADKALELYGDPNLNHSFSARFRKSLALRRLGRFGEALTIYELHRNLRVQDTKISDQERARLIANEDKNIAATKEEMQRLGLI